MRVKSLLMAGSVCAAAIFSAGTAYAGPSLNFTVSVWNALTPGSTISSANQQAVPTSPLNTSADLVATFDYAGLPNWFNGGGSNNYLGTFIGNGNGTISNLAYSNGGSADTVLSTGSFASASLFELTFTTTHSVSGSITHDDGLSLWNSANTSELVNSATPTNAIPTTFSLPDPGTYNLWYVEANGAPAELSFNNVQVPEPGSLLVLGTGLLGLGLVLRRRKRG